MSTRKFRVGRDRVEVRADTLVVITPVQTMTGWEVSRYRPSVIRFDGRTWRVTARTTGRDNFTRYELTAWEPSAGELTGPEIDYSVDDVTLRDQVQEVSRRRGRITLVLNLVRPFTGFLAARTKDRLEILHGIDPVASTTASIVIQVSATLCLLALASIAQMVKVYGFDSGIPTRLALLAAVVVGVDAVVRWSKVLEEVRPAPGFCEWLFRTDRHA